MTNLWDKLFAKKWVVPLLLVAVTFIVYAQSFQNQFLAGDEESIFLRNIYLRDWHFLGRFFSENYKSGGGELSNYWRPFQMLLSFFVVNTVGMLPWPFHVLNLLLHAGAAYFLFLILNDFFSQYISKPLIILGVLLWLVHPAHNEELAVASGGASPAHLFWMLWAIYFSLRYQDQGKPKALIAAVLGQILALWSKESAVILPGLILGTHLVLINLGRLPAPKSRPRFLWPHCLFWLVGFSYVGMRLTVLNFDNSLNFYHQENALTESFFNRIYTFSTIIAHQIRIFILPYDLHPERQWQVFTELSSLPVLVGLALLACLLVCFFYFWKKAPLVSLGIGWFLGSYLPMSNLFAPINALVWDHWLYTPSVGLIILIVWFLQKWPQRIAVIVLGIFVVGAAAITWQRSEIWKNTESVSRTILEYEPQNAKSMVNLAVALADKGQIQEAIQYYRQAIALDDEFAQTHHNLANALISLHQYGEAEKELRRAIQIQGNFYFSYNLLGELLEFQGRREEAKPLYERSLQIFPQQPDIRERLGH